jgi:hypothetical protein
VFGMGTGGSSSLGSPRRGRHAGGGWPEPHANIDGHSERSNRCCRMYAVEIMVKPNGQLVTVSSTHYCAYTSVLSNWSSTSALQSFRLGDLILGKVSRLYAFSVYPDRTSLPSGAPGGTTGSQEVRPPRSSRTKGRPPQISYAHHR